MLLDFPRATESAQTHPCVCVHVRVENSRCHHPAPARGAPVTLLVSQSSKFTKSMMFKSTDHIAAGKLRFQSFMRSCSAPGDWLGFQPRFPMWAVSRWSWGGVCGCPLGAQRECGCPGGPCPSLRVWMLTLGLQWMMWAPSCAHPLC